MNRRLTRFGSLVLVVLVLLVGLGGLAGTAEAAPAPAAAQPPIPGIPGVPGIPDIPGVPDVPGVPGVPGVEVYPTCMVSPVDCFISGLVTHLSEDASKFLMQILSDLTDSARFSPGSGGFMAQYSLGLTIALFVLCFLLMRLFYKMSRHPDKMPEYRESLLHHLPIGLALCVVGPGFGALLAGLADSLTDGIISVTDSGDTMYTTVNGAITELQRSDTPLVAILLLFGLIVSCVMVIITLLLQTLALYLTGSVMAIAFVMTIDPDMRKRAAKLPTTWVGILFAKPLLFFMMGMVVKLINEGGLADDPRIAMLLASLALLVVALSPFTLRKYAPIIPGGGDATASEAGGAAFAGAGEVATTATNPMLHTNGAATGASAGQLAIGADRSATSSSSSTSQLGHTTQTGGRPMLLNQTANPMPPLSAAPVGASGGTATTGAAATGTGAFAGLAAYALPVAVGVAAYKGAKGVADSAAPNIEGSE